MMAKTTRKLVLKKELLRTLDERHLRVVDGGKLWVESALALPSDDERPSGGPDCVYSLQPGGGI